jgi:hypothetical protein
MLQNFCRCCIFRPPGGMPFHKPLVEGPLSINQAVCNLQWMQWCRPVRRRCLLRNQQVWMATSRNSVIQFVPPMGRRLGYSSQHASTKCESSMIAVAVYRATSPRSSWKQLWLWAYLFATQLSLLTKEFLGAIDFFRLVLERCYEAHIIADGHAAAKAKEQGRSWDDQAAKWISELHSKPEGICQW